MITQNLIRNVEYEFATGIMPDFVISPTACALFLSMRYHQLKPTYIAQRIEELRTSFRLRLLLVLVDQDDNVNLLLELNKMAVARNFTLLLAWSWPEAARYLETFKAFENKPPTSIQEKVNSDYLAKAQDALCTVHAVNRTDVVTLLSTFGSLQGLCEASMEEMALCPGLGDKKVVALHDALHQPFFSARGSASAGGDGGATAAAAAEAAADAEGDAALSEAPADDADETAAEVVDLDVDEELEED
ncbi:restriction endonuclease type II-like protein [Tribonema minus]|uniref:DNA excision repair protein ERCC-1 n=1 Tax=Tribonema minus TaxID=303371 RepID=A0A835ZCX2_9STRA|nr:restriction endonuclease type II-like protein [Tribonema minus]